MCMEDRAATESEITIGRRQMTTLDYQKLKLDPRLERFLREWLEVFAPTLIKCACCNGLPPWLLASVVIGEVVAMDEWLGIDERTLEEQGVGSSVGVAQIRVDTAIKYGLTPLSSNFDAEVERSKQAEEDALRRAAEAGFVPAPTYRPSDMHETLVRARIRRELLNPVLCICASARNLRGLRDRARDAGAINDYVVGPDGPEPWGDFDFSNVGPCGQNLLQASRYPAADEQMRRIARFFGAAHNDDRLRGFQIGYGFTQGENAGSIADDLIGFGLIQAFNLLECPREFRCRGG